MTTKYSWRMFAPLLAIVLAAALAGCKTTALKASTSQWDAPKSADAVFLLATIDMSDMPGYFQEATLERLSPEPKTTIHSFRVKRDKDSCVFFNEDLSTGRYQLVDFTIRLPDRDITFKMGDGPRFQGNFTTPGVHYLGTFKPREVRRHGKTSYELAVVRRPDERQAIERILPDASDDTWKKLLIERARQLRR